MWNREKCILAYLMSEQLGYGLSDPCSLPRPIHFMHNEGLEVLPQLIDEAGIRECILIGHSDGGSIAIIYMCDTTAIPLRGLINATAHLFCEEKTVDSISQARDIYRQRDLRLKLAKYHGKNTDCTFWGWNKAWFDPDFRQWNLEEYLPGIKVPMLANQGKNDKYGSDAQIESIERQADLEAEILPQHDCGHCPHRDQEEVVLKAMTDFISDLLPQKLC